MKPSRDTGLGLLTRARSIGTAGGALASLFLVLFTVFVYTSRLAPRDSAVPVEPTGSRVEAAGQPATEDRAGGAAQDPSPRSLSGTGSPGPSAPAASAPATALEPVRPGVLPPGPPSSWVESEALGLRTELPQRWQRAFLSGGAAPLGAADVDLVAEDPGSGARIAISAWEAEGLPPLHLWLPSVAGGMQAVDGRWPVNAHVAGVPALLLWAPESPTVPARYAIFLARGGRYYRLAYAAYDGGAAIGAFATALTRLSWLDAADSEAAAADMVPPMPLPESRYFPGDGLLPLR